MIYFILAVLLLVILYLIRLHIGLKADAAIRVKNNAALTKQLKAFDEAIKKLERDARRK